MKKEKKTRGQLISELAKLRQRIAELEKAKVELERAEEQLRQTKEVFARAEQIGRFGHWYRDFAENNATWSEGTYRIFSGGPEQLDISYEAFLALVHPSDRELLKSAVEAALAEGEGLDTEYRIIRPDGTVRNIHSFAEVRFDKSGKPVGLDGTVHDITKRKKAEEALRKSEAELAAKSRHLEEVNAALKALLRQRENDKADLEKRLHANVKELVLPYVEKLKKSRSYSDRMTILGILESNMKEIVSPFVTTLSSRFFSLTPTEIQVAGLIKDGKSSKEIAVLINASENTVRSHRFHIRSKLGIKNKKVNLRSYLQSIQD